MFHHLFLISAKLVSLQPRISMSKLTDWLRIAVGSMLGCGLSIAAAEIMFDHSTAVLLAGPLGASAVLVFAVSSGALSQPWPLFGGYFLATAIAIGLSLALGHSSEVACLAIALVVLAMFALRCVHPPAAALTLVLAFTEAPGGSGWAMLLPPMLGVTVLFVWAVIYNNITGRQYPKFDSPLNTHHTADITPDRRVGITDSDLQYALNEFGEFVDITPGDLERLVSITERSLLRRQMGDVRAGQIMARDVRFISPQTSVLATLQILRHHHVKTLPVLDKHNELVGIISLSDLMGQIDKPDGKLFAARIKAWREQPIRKWMSTPVISVEADLHVAELIPLMSTHGLHSVPVLEQGRLVGLITQTDLIAALHRDLVAHLFKPH